MPPALVGEVPARALAVYAHPDDPEVACAGTLARWVRAGSEVHLVVCTLGEKGTADPATDPAALAERRAGEVSEAAAVLGLAGVVNLGYPDGEIVNDAILRERLVGEIRRIRPEAVLSPDPTAVYFGDTYVNHRDHREVGWAVLDACSPASASPLYFPTTGPPHRVSTLYLSGTLAPDAWVDIGDSLGAKVEALRCHRTQLGDGVDLVGDVLTQRAAEAGRQAGVAYAEGYRRLRLG
jgi:LmbE family N-acetylglucosaminyl deacetylase